MSKQTLRGLAKDFAKGVIDKESYRKSRTVLIKDIIEGSISVKAIDYEGPLRPSNDIEEAITEGIERDRTQITSPKNSAAHKPDNVPHPLNQNVSVTNNKKSPFIFVIVSVVIVVSLIAAVILFYPKPPEPTIVKDNSITVDNSSTVAAKTSASESAAAESLIGAFLNEKNWGEENLGKFVESWSALTPEERNSAADTKRMQRMKASIYKQFLEGKALSSIDSEKAKMKQQMLIEFANAIGIDDSRLIVD
ncbi:MAG: hypothetical protein HND53_00915 [Proteobacteria bacterium]|nr:hypothetical protein [Pseudomonadota bacterium]NOG59034.1 hypothetical protein [Pseudomonadota bacterium]